MLSLERKGKPKERGGAVMLPDVEGADKGDYEEGQDIPSKASAGLLPDVEGADKSDYEEGQDIPSNASTGSASVRVSARAKVGICMLRFLDLHIFLVSPLSLTAASISSFPFSQLT